jgi:septal ring factor EnvC (AmiA/AmiB activator)
MTGTGAGGGCGAALGRKIRGRALARAAALLLLWGLAGARPLAAQETQAPGSLSDPRAQIQQIRAEREQMERRLAGFKLSERETLGEIEQLAGAVSASRKRKRVLETELARSHAERVRRDEELTDLNVTIRAAQQRLGKRLRRLYRFTKAEQSATLFQLARFKSFARDSHVLARLQQSDQEALRKFEAARLDLLRKQAELRETLTHLEALKAELDTESDLLREREKGLQESLANLRRNQELYGRYLGELETAQSGVEDALAKLERTPAPGNAAATDPLALRGKLPPPALGKLVAGFGQQDPRYQLKKFQRGIVIRVTEGTEVRAVAGGSAVHAGPFRGYQDLVVLDHGNGVFTVYGHLERVAIKKGDWVARDAVLGYATYQPEDQAFDVYFEIRAGGKPEDPMQWLEPGKLHG